MWSTSLHAGHHQLKEQGQHLPLVLRTRCNPIFPKRLKCAMINRIVKINSIKNWLIKVPPPIQKSNRASHKMPTPSHNKSWHFFYPPILQWNMASNSCDQSDCPYLINQIKRTVHPKLGSIELPSVIPIGAPQEKLQHVPCITRKVLQKNIAIDKNLKQVDRCRSIHTKKWLINLPERIWSVGLITTLLSPLYCSILFARCLVTPIESDLRTTLFRIRCGQFCMQSLAGGLRTNTWKYFVVGSGNLSRKPCRRLKISHFITTTGRIVCVQSFAVVGDFAQSPWSDFDACFSARNPRECLGARSCSCASWFTRQNYFKSSDGKSLW